MVYLQPTAWRSALALLMCVLGGGRGLASGGGGGARLLQPLQLHVARLSAAELPCRLALHCPDVAVLRGARFSEVVGGVQLAAVAEAHALETLHEGPHRLRQRGARVMRARVRERCSLGAGMAALPPLRRYV